LQLLSVLQKCNINATRASGLRLRDQRSAARTGNATMEWDAESDLARTDAWALSTI
jgi:hypothetical protein